MADGNIGFFSQLWRFFTFYKLRKSLGLARAAERQFTTSAQGVADAHDIYLMQKQKEVKEFFDALAGLAMAIEGKKTELENMRKNKAVLTKKRNGAAVVIEQQEKLLEKVKSEEAKAEITAKLEKAKLDGQGFSAELKKIDEDEPALVAFVAEKQKGLVPLESRRKKMIEEIKALPAKKAEAVAKFITNKQLLEAYDRINGLTSPADRGPLDAVDEMLKQQDAKVKVSGHLAEDATNAGGDEYLEAGSTEAGDNDFDAFLKARKADKEAKTGEGTTAQTEERPKI